MPRIGTNFQAVLRTALDSQKLLSVSEGAELLYYKLLLASDSEGHFHGSPFQVLSRVLTARAEKGSVTLADVESRLSELAKSRLLGTYEVDGQQFLELTDYFDPTAESRKKVQFPNRPESSILSHEGTFQAMGDACPQTGDEMGTNRGHLSPLTPTPTPTNTPTKGSLREPSVPASPELGLEKVKTKKPRVNGLEELAGAINLLEDAGALNPLDVEFADAAEGYRKLRTSRKFPVYKTRDWTDNFEAAVFDGGFSRESMIDALKTATRAKWQSLHPKKPNQAKPTSHENLMRGIELGNNPNYGTSR